MVSSFIKVRCPKCKNEQVVFAKPASQVNCVICSYALAKPKASKAAVKGRVIEVYN